MGVLYCIRRSPLKCHRLLDSSVGSLRRKIYAGIWTLTASFYCMQIAILVWLPSVRLSARLKTRSCENCRIYCWLAELTYIDKRKELAVL